VVIVRVRQREGRAVARVVALAAVALVTVGCSTTTPVELDSAGAPEVVPVDGAHPNDPQVIDAGAVQLDDPAAATTAVPTTSEPASSTAGGVAARDVEQVCSRDRRTLEDAVRAFTKENGRPPTSDAELAVDSYIRNVSELYDVRIDGSVVPQGDTCLGID
jgi:hypothetical protein